MCKLEKVAADYSVKRLFFGVAVWCFTRHGQRGWVKQGFLSDKRCLILIAALKIVPVEMLSETFENYFSP